jgi:hypothetical protein
MTDAILHVSAVEPSSGDVHQILKGLRTSTVIIIKLEKLNHALIFDA